MKVCKGSTLRVITKGPFEYKNSLIWSSSTGVEVEYD